MRGQFGVLEAAVDGLGALVFPLAFVDAGELHVCPVNHADSLLDGDAGLLIGRGQRALHPPVGVVELCVHHVPRRVARLAGVQVNRVARELRVV